MTNETIRVDTLTGAEKIRNAIGTLFEKANQGDDIFSERMRELCEKSGLKPMDVRTRVEETLKYGIHGHINKGLRDTFPEQYKNAPAINASTFAEISPGVAAGLVESTYNDVIKQMTHEKETRGLGTPESNGHQKRGK